MKGHRYRIDRVYRPGYSQPESEAPTIDEAHAWVLDRIRRAGKVGLRLRPLDFEVVDTWDEIASQSAQLDAVVSIER